MTTCRRLAAVALLMLPPVGASDLTSVDRHIITSIDQRRDAAIDLLARSVHIQSASENHDGVRRVGELYAAELKALGFDPTWVDQKEVGRAGHLVAEHHGTRGTRVLIIGHLDTVLQGEPFRREGRKGYGSGSSDMKAGNLIAITPVGRPGHASSSRVDGTQATRLSTGVRARIGQ